MNSNLGEVYIYCFRIRINHIYSAMSFQELYNISKYFVRSTIITCVARADLPFSSNTSTKDHGQQPLTFENSKSR